jgi:copper chaperone CopZ
MAERTETFRIRGVDDEHERLDVADTLGHLDGVLAADVEADGSAEVRYDDDVLAAADLHHRVEKMGYATA